MFADFYRGKRVLVTGHTGFKGSWLCEWLLLTGAEVAGFSLAPATQPALFDLLGLQGRLRRHVIGDIGAPGCVGAAISAFDPEVIFHLAAQPLVRSSYVHPIDTYQTNVMGTAYLLEAIRQRSRPCTVVVITSDKCYQNKEWLHGYREEDPLGGLDPYSSSKGCSEIITAAYRQSFFTPGEHGVRICSARAGNVIGGGDWALDRIVPDCIRSLQAGAPIPVRNRMSTRPWQHVLEPLSGYLLLGAALATADPDGSAVLASAFNFGPALTSNQTVAALVEEILRHWPGTWTDRSDPRALHEAVRLHLSTDKAHHLLRWQPAWDFREAVKHTVEWYRAQDLDRADPVALTTDQIRHYLATAQARGLAWTE